MVGKSSRENSKNEVTWGENNRPLIYKGTRYGAFTIILIDKRKNKRDVPPTTGSSMGICLTCFN